MALKDDLDQRLEADPSTYVNRPDEVESRLTPAKLGLTHDVLTEAIGKLEAPYDRIAVFKVLGVITRIKLVTDMSGKRWPALYSDAGFEGQNLLTGEVMRSRVCFLPGNEHEDAVDLLREEGLFDPAEFPEYLRKNEEERINRFDTRGIEFALVFSIKPAKGAYGYRWIAQEIVPVRKADPLAAIRGPALGWRLPAKAMPLTIEHQPAAK